MALPQLNSTDTEDFFTIFRYINGVTGDLFFPIILGSFWIILFILGLSSGREASRSWIFACFVCGVLAIPLALMGFLGQQYMYFIIILLAFGMLWHRFSNAPS